MTEAVTAPLAVIEPPSIPELTGKLRLEHDHDAAAEILEARFASYLDPAVDPDLEAAYDHDRWIFDVLPALTVDQTGASGLAPRSSSLPESMLFATRVYHPSLYGALGAGDVFRVTRDARAEAKRLTRRILGRWEAVLRADKQLRRAVEVVRPVEWAFGDADRLGNLRMSGTGDSVLWVARLIFEVRP